MVLACRDLPHRPDYGRLKIAGTATLAGLLDLYDPNSVVTVGSTFELLTFAGGKSGTFNSLAYQGTALTDMGGGSWTDGTLLFREIWSPTSLSLTVSAVPEPSPIVLGTLGIAGGLLLRARKRRASTRRRQSRSEERVRQAS